MENKKKRYLIGLLLIITLIRFFSLGISYIIKKNTPVIVNKNVKIITDDIPYEYQIYDITDNSLIYLSDPKYEIGDVLVSGITSSAPNGFIRKIISISNEDGFIVYNTEPATLVDVFEKAHIVKQFRFTDGELIEIENGNTDDIISVSQKFSEATAPAIKTLAYQNTPSLLQLSEDEPFFKIEKKLNVQNRFDINIKAEIDLWIELQIDIENGNIVFGVTAHNTTSGNVNITEDKEFKLSERITLPKLLKEYDLPNIQFYIANIPVVVTNERRVYVDGELKIGGNFETDVSLDSESIVGFEYDSRIGEIREINEKKYLSDGIEWDTEIGAFCNTEILLELHLITKLYGSTGADLSVGISGKVSGEVSAETSDTGGIETYGKLEMSIMPEIVGKVIVEMPIIDYKLLETPLFELPMSPLWEHTWENKSNLLMDCRDERFLIYEGGGLRLYTLIDKENPTEIYLYGINYSGRRYNIVFGFGHYKNLGIVWKNFSEYIPETKAFFTEPVMDWKETYKEETNNDLSFRINLYEIDKETGSRYIVSAGDEFIFSEETINSQILSKDDIVRRYSGGSIIDKQLEIEIPITSDINLSKEETKEI